MKAQSKILLPLITVFLICNALLLTSARFLVKQGVDQSVLIIANIVLFLLTIGTFFMQQNALKNSNPNVFFRSVMAGMMIKMFACILAILVYRLVAVAEFNTANVFAGLLIYLVYLAVEVRLVSKLNRQKNG